MLWEEWREKKTNVDQQFECRSPKREKALNTWFVYRHILVSFRENQK